MSDMVGVITIITIVLESVKAIVLGSVWMGTSYAAPKRGLARGASKHELEQIRHDIAQGQRNTADFKEQIAELIVVSQEIP